MDSYFLGIDIRIKMASRESSGNKKAIHFGIPSSGSLLETIKRFFDHMTFGASSPRVRFLDVYEFFHYCLL
jgi:hypothetical protein